jgi:hypothetical protein
MARIIIDLFSKLAGVETCMLSQNTKVILTKYDAGPL